MEGEVEMQEKLRHYVKAMYGEVEMAPCPFTDEEIAELESSEEFLVYLPKRITMAEMCERWGIRANVEFENEKMIRNIMVAEDQWFVCSAASTPELIYRSGQAAQRVYEDEGLHGMDLRRYLAFCATYKLNRDEWPDKTYWTFLLSGSYDRSGVSVVGFDKHDVLSHHGWMKNFKTKFSGSRYVVIAPRIEITRETAELPRARRGSNLRANREADLD
jgi:hypothetical protein